MVLVRSARREREIAVRLAMGASRRRLIQSLLSESLVLAALGGALAAVVLYGVPQVIVWWNETSIPDPRLQPDAMMVLFCVGLCFATSLIFGLLPAIRFSRPSLVNALKDESAGGGGRRVGRTQRITAAIQASIAVPFLVISAVKLDQVRTTATAELGFSTAGLYSVPLVADVDVNDVKSNLLRVPGVESVAVADGLPLDFDAREVRVQRDASSPTQWAHTTRIGDGYFETMKIPLLRGRAISAEDQKGGALVVVLSQPLAALLFPGEDALGKQVAMTFTDRPWYHTVIGVTGDVVASQMASPRPQMYLALSQHETPRMMLIARAAGPPEGVHAGIEKVLPNVDRNILRASVLTGPGLVTRSQQDLAEQSAMSAACAAIALILTALGTFGVIGFMVATRTREIGVRIALGASQSRVLGMVLLDTVKIIAPGIAFGLVMAIYVVRADLFEFSMFSLGIVEPLAYAVGAGITITVALLSGLPTARRAAKVQPIIAMRAE
jgi:putative ABC transport system permease protein